MNANESKPHKAIAHDVYEYAGFKYAIERDANGKAVGMSPVPGQHPAAMKGTHRRNALAMYLEDAGQFEKVRAAIAKLPPVDLGPDSFDPFVPTPTRWRASDVRKPSTVVGVDHHVTCPSCDEPITQGAAHCSACGALL